MLSHARVLSVWAYSSHSMSQRQEQGEYASTRRPFTPVLSPPHYQPVPKLSYHAVALSQRFLTDTFLSQGLQAKQRCTQLRRHQTSRSDKKPSTPSSDLRRCGVRAHRGSKRNSGKAVPARSGRREGPLLNLEIKSRPPSFPGHRASSTNRGPVSESRHFFLPSFRRPHCE